MEGWAHLPVHRVLLYDLLGMKGEVKGYGEDCIYFLSLSTSIQASSNKTNKPVGDKNQKFKKVFYKSYLECSKNFFYVNIKT